MQKPSHIHWTNALFFTITPLLAIAGTTWWAMSGNTNANTIVLTIVLWALGGLSITAGYHRLFSHKSFKAHWSVKALTLFFGASTFEGPAWVWVSDHRNHHKHQDTDKDPYSITKGFWHAHILWLFDGKRYPSMDNISDLKNDVLAAFQYKYYNFIAIASGFLMPMAIASIWGDPLGGLFVAGFLRMVFNQHVTFAINSVCHAFGSKPYNLKLTARDNALTALFTFGEGYHNFHHQFPHDYRNGLYWYQWDPTKWLIASLEKVGLAEHLKTVPSMIIHQKRIDVQETALKNKLLGQTGSEFEQTANLILKSAKEQYQIALTELDKLNKQYLALKAQHSKSLNQQIKRAKYDLKIARHNLKAAILMWHSLIHGLGKLKVA